MSNEKRSCADLARHRRALAASMACALVLSLAGCASTHLQEGTGEYVDDSVVTGKVKAAVFNEPTLKSAEINVETFKGSVQMSGFVATQVDIDKAVALARGIKGVTAVRNDMVVKGAR